MERLTLEDAISRSRKLAERHRWNSEYTKLETSDKNANEVYKKTCIQYANQEEQYAEWIEELKSYKEAEEQGLLVRLPCKVGDSLHCIIEGTVKKLKACSFIISGSGIIDVDLEYEDAFCCIRYIRRFSENVFFTHEEAEKKMEEMKND